jgi:hypothetical protein
MRKKLLVVMGLVAACGDEGDSATCEVEGGEACFELPTAPIATSKMGAATTPDFSLRETERDEFDASGDTQWHDEALHVGCRTRGHRDRDPCFDDVWLGGGDRHERERRYVVDHAAVGNAQRPASQGDGQLDPAGLFRVPEI